MNRPIVLFAFFASKVRTGFVFEKIRGSRFASNAHSKTSYLSARASPRSQNKRCVPPASANVWTSNKIFFLCSAIKQALGRHLTDPLLIIRFESQDVDRSRAGRVEC